MDIVVIKKSFSNIQIVFLQYLTTEYLLSKKQKKKKTNLVKFF